MIASGKRNADRFPDDFMFQFSEEELENWRSQIVISNPAAKMGLRRRPYAFTELGVAMLSTVLRSKRAVQVNIAIMRAFVKLRQLLSTKEGRSTRSRGGYPQMESSGKRMRSAPLPRARRAKSIIFSEFPEKSPMTVLIWPSAILTLSV